MQMFEIILIALTDKQNRILGLDEKGNITQNSFKGKINYNNKPESTNIRSVEFFNIKLMPEFIKEDGKIIITASLGEKLNRDVVFSNRDTELFALIDEATRNIGNLKKVFETEYMIENMLVEGENTISKSALEVL